MSVPAIFSFQDHEVRIVQVDEAPWFVATDVALALGYHSPKDAASHLDDDEKGSAIVRTPGGDQKVTVINESGLYALVLRSRKPEARRFAKWVTSEVLPAIRQTGHYSEAAHPMDFDFAYLAEVRNKTYDYTEQCGQMIRDLGGQPPKWPELPAEEIAQAVVADIVRFCSFLAHVDDRGRLRLMQLPKDSRVISPKSIGALKEMVTFGVPDELIPELTRHCISRMEYMAKKGLKKH